MPETFTADRAVQLAVVERSGFVESRHLGSAIVLAPDGTTLRALGDVDTPILPRSSMKPLQALACLTAGAPLEGAELALATASHSGTDRHAETVRDMLRTAGLDESALQCPPDWPTDAAARAEMIRELGTAQRVRMNCSGKHAAMLSACVAQGWDTVAYLEPDHPLQVHIREVVERMTGTKVGAAAVDGCGAPVYAMSLAALARGVQRAATSSPSSPFALHRSAAQVIRAVLDHPWTVDGPGRPDTVVAERLGVFAKVGAEGVQVMVAPDGTTAALKMLDGSSRAAAVTALALLTQAGALPAPPVAQVLTELPLTVHGGGRPVGTIRPTV